jgi:hypothetical protein
MPKVNVKEIRERVAKMNDGWAEGAPTVDFNGVGQSEFTADIAEAAAADRELADIETQKTMKIVQIETLYSNLNAKSVRVANGVRGHKDFGTDSPLYGAMGFVRDSERASGLTRKPKKPNGE